MTNLLRRLRVNSSLIIGEETLPLASRIPANPLQFAPPFLLRRFGLPFVSAPGFRLNASLLFGLLFFLLVAVHLDVLGPLQSRLSRLPTLRGECLRTLSSFPRFFSLKTKAVNHTFTKRMVGMRTSKASCFSFSSCLTFFARANFSAFSPSYCRWAWRCSSAFLIMLSPYFRL